MSETLFWLSHRDQRRILPLETHLTQKWTFHHFWTFWHSNAFFSIRPFLEINFLVILKKHDFSKIGPNFCVFGPIVDFLASNESQWNFLSFLAIFFDFWWKLRFLEPNYKKITIFGQKMAFFKSAKWCKKVQKSKKAKNAPSTLGNP